MILSTLKRKLLLRALVAGVVLNSGAAHAIGLVQAYQAALQNDPAFRVAFYDNEAGKEYKNIGRSTLLPNLSANYAASKNRADITVHGTLSDNVQHPEYTSRSASISVRQPLFNLDALARYQQGKAQSLYSESQYTSQRQELALRVIGAYVDALFGEEQLALATAQRDTYLEQKKVNDRLFEKGEGTKTDMLETQARLDVSEAQILEYRDNLVNARNTLSGIVGMEVTSVEGLAPTFGVRDLSPARFEDWKVLALANNPDLVAQGYAVEVARQEVNKNRAGHAPRVDLVGSYSKNSSETLNTFNQDSTVRSVGVQLSVPIYSGGYVNAVTRQAVAGQERARADLQARTDKVLIELRKEFNIASSSVAKIDALGKAVESGKLLMKATEQSIKGGVRINLDLLNAQQQLFASQRDLAQARFNYLVALLRLRAAAGTLMAGDIDDVARYFR